MLMNNLDPEVAERPDDLVVYGGIGRAARNWDCYDRIVRCLRELGDDETLLVQSGKPVGVFRTHADAPRVLIANSNLVGRWSTWDHFHELDRKGLMMYGQMTAGSWIYIGSQGIVQGTYETFVEMGRQHYGGNLAGKLDPHGGPRRHGRRATARGHDGRRIDARDRMPARAHPEATRYPLSRRGRADARRSAARHRRSAGAAARPSASACWATRPKCCPNCCAVACGPMPSPTRPPRTIRSTATCRQAGRSSSGTSDAPAIRAAVEQAARRSMAQARRGDARIPATRHPGLRLRQQHPAGGARRGREECLRISRVRAGLRAAAVLPRHRTVPLGRAVRRSRGHPSHGRQGQGADPGRSRTCTAGSTWRANASSSRACRRASAGSGSASVTASASPSTRWWRAANSRRRS